MTKLCHHHRMRSFHPPPRVLLVLFVCLVSWNHPPHHACHGHRAGAILSFVGSKLKKDDRPKRSDSSTKSDDTSTKRDKLYSSFRKIPKEQLFGIGCALVLGLLSTLLLATNDEEGKEAAESNGTKKATIDGDSLSTCDIGFESIEMVLRPPKNKKHKDRVILDGSIKAKASPGRMLAIMGPSGSGKTTLLHAVAGQLKQDKRITLKGNRYVNGEPVSGDSQLPIAFIEQQVNFFPHMTVKETLDFRVELKLGNKQLSKRNRDDVVNNLMTMLGLVASANTRVGDDKVRGLSGGERKRLSIACELISSPLSIFLDEPTSGLDSYQAAQLVGYMRKLADNGKTIIAVIHQPSQHVFSMFDDLLLISEGKQMYFGEVAKVRSYLDKLGYGCDEGVGTAEHVLDCVSRSGGGTEEREQSDERLKHLAEQATLHAKNISVSKHENGTATKMTLKRFETNKNGAPAANIFHQFKLLLNRALHEVLRGKATIAIKIVQQVTLGLIYGGIYKLGDNQASIMDRIGLLSLIAIGAMNMAAASTVRAFPKEKAIVSNEIGKNMYRTLPYFASKAISEIPLVAVYNALFGAIIYPLAGLRKGGFKTFIGLTTLHSITSEAAGLLIGAISPNSDVALALFPPFVVLNIVFDGKNISAENTPRLLRWIPKVGLIRWAFEGLAINEFTGLNFVSRGPPRGPVTKTGIQALDRFGLATREVGDVIRAQTNIVLVCWILSVLGLTLTRQKFAVMHAPASTK